MTLGLPRSLFSPFWVATFLTVAAVLLGTLMVCVSPTIFSTTLSGSAVAMVVIVWLSFLAGLVPVAAVASRGVTAMVYGYFLGTAIRVVLCLSAMFVAIKFWGVSDHCVALTVVPSYLILLLIESGLIGRSLWLDSTPRHPTQSHGSDGHRG